MVIYSKIRLGVTPDINALAALIIALVSIGVIAAGWIMLVRDRRRVPGRPSG
jgi:putrescine transport system permease protein